MLFFAPLFATPVLSLTVIYIAAAVLPAFFLLRYIYRKDTVEKEPPDLLVSLLLQGVLAALVSVVLETVGEKILDNAMDASSPAYTFALAFLVVALAEEGSKFFFLYRRTWNNPNFNYRFDAIVYAVFISLGFAAFENVKYVFSYGLSVALPRAVLSVPGHMGFSVFMGIFYGRARYAADCGKSVKSRAELVFAYLSAVILHGVYDTCCMLGTNLSTVVFVLFVLSMYVLVFLLIRRESKQDMPI